jgi:hypothetical protein
MTHGGIIQQDSTNRYASDVHGVDSDSRHYDMKTHGGRGDIDAAQRDYSAAMYGNHGHSTDMNSHHAKSGHSHTNKSNNRGGHDEQEQILLSFRAQGATLAHSNRASIHQPRNPEYDSESGLKGPAQRDEHGFWVDACTGKPMGLTVCDLFFSGYLCICGSIQIYAYTHKFNMCMYACICPHACV